MASDIIGEIRRRLIEDRQATLALIEELGEHEAQRRPRPDAWSIKNHVAHLAAVEEAVIDFARRTQREERPAADGYDVDAWNAQQQAQRAGLSWEQTLAELAQARRRLLALLDELPPQALARTASHPVWGSPITLSSVLRVPYRHERGHRDEIRALKESRALPLDAP
jgi:hypothetical protein